MESPRKRQRQRREAPPPPPSPQKWLLYLTLDEPEDFNAQLTALQNSCPFFCRSCFQLDGTRHVTVVRAFDMNPEDARQVRAQQPAMSTLLANLRIRVRPWAFNNSNSGIYLDASVPGADDIAPCATSWTNFRDCPKTSRPTKTCTCE